MKIQELMKEERISIPKLADREGVHFSTVWRWMKGTKQRPCKLETFKIGGNTYTTEERFLSFVEECNK